MINLTEAVKIYKNTHVFGDVVMVEIFDKNVDNIEKKSTITKLFSDNQLVGLNIFDPTLLSAYPNGFIYPEKEVLKQLNNYLKQHNVEVTFNYTKEDYLKVAKVLKVSKVEGSDNLSLCNVSIDGDEYSMICGAKNVKAGMKTIAALDNALLSDGTKVTSGEVLGVFSDGMLCSLKELGLDPDKAFNGIVELDEDEIVGTSFFEVDWRKYNV